MSAIDTLFQELRQSGRKAFMPFITAGDPDLEFTKDLLLTLDANGCSLCELGIPYSDPIADGPVIQASYTRALENQLKLRQIFEMTADLTPRLQMPVVMMVSYAIVHRHGNAEFVTRAKQAGAAGMIVPDLLVEESAEISQICTREDFSLIQLVTPTTSRERAVRIAESSSGFIYFVSVTGITGERDQLPSEIVEDVGWLREQTNLPICVGFGISKAEHVRVLAPVADGLIVGSAIVRQMSQIPNDSRKEVLRGISDYVSELMAALR